jgi:glycosyltransferase 2 family protein
MASRAPGVSRRTRWLRPAAGAALGVGFALLLARGVDWADVGQLLAGASPGALMLGVTALGAGMLVRITRWWWMLRAFDPALPLASCARPFLVSLALNNTLPLRAGDVVRIFGFGRVLRAPAARVLGTVMLERLLDLMVLLLFFGLAVVGAAGVFPRGFLVAAAGAGVVGGTALLLLIGAPAMVARALESLVRLVGTRWPRLRPVQPLARQLVDALGLLADGRRSAALLALSLTAWMLEGLVFVASAAALDIVHPWPAPWLALAAATLSTLLPGTPGYVGTFDYFATLGLVAYGVNGNAAAAVAVLVHVLLWLPVTVTGLALLGLRTRRQATLEAGAT